MATGNLLALLDDITTVLDDGIQFSDRKTRRDWTEEIHADIRAFYRQFTDKGGGIAKLKFSLSRSTGKISGTFTHPESGKKTSYYGVLDQKQDVGAGYFLGSTQGGLVRLEAAP